MLAVTSERQAPMPDPQEALDGLRLVAIERAAGIHIGSNRLIEAGLDALLAGLDSPSLRLLAGLGRREEPEAPELFARVVEELGLAPGIPCDHDQALWALARWWAGLIVQGKLDPAEGADLILWRVAAELGHPGQLQEIVAGALAADDWTADWTIPLERIKAQIITASRVFLASQGTVGW
jgi:hypothetical protein